MRSYEGDMACIYDKLIIEDIDYKKWSEKIIELCIENDIDFNNYLDLGCGTGNLTKELYKYFKNTWAVDLSSDMLCRCQQKIDSGLQNIRFICQDIRELNLNKQFDCITSSLDVINYIIDSKELEISLLNVYNHLKEGGVFIFDINSYYKLSYKLGNNTFFYDDEEIFYHWDNEFNEDILDMNLTLFIKKGQVYERIDELHTERAYSEADMDKTLKNVGFRVIKKVDNYTDSRISKETERITYMVKK